MAFITTLIGGLGLVATAGRDPGRDPGRAARLEWFGGMLLVVSFVGLGFDLAQATG